MRIKLVIGITASLLVATATTAAEKSAVAFRNKLVTPDPALAAFVDGLRQALTPAAKLDYARIDGLFAKRVNTFQRGLDPLQPWKKTADIKADYLVSAADLMVEQGDLPQGAKPVDRRPDAARQMLSVLSEGTFSLMSQVPFSVCTPAAYKVNAAVVRAFATTQHTDGASLRFFATDLDLKKLPTPAAKSNGTVPAGTLLAPKHDSTLSDDWELLVGSNGVKGYRRIADAAARQLSQRHVCFGKFTDGYKITALFGYGL